MLPVRSPDYGGTVKPGRLATGARVGAGNVGSIRWTKPITWCG